MGITIQKTVEANLNNKVRTKEKKYQCEVLTEDNLKMMLKKIIKCNNSQTPMRRPKLTQKKNLLL